MWHLWRYCSNVTQQRTLAFCMRHLKAVGFSVGQIWRRVPATQTPQEHQVSCRISIQIWLKLYINGAFSLCRQCEQDVLWSYWSFLWTEPEDRAEHNRGRCIWWRARQMLKMRSSGPQPVAFHGPQVLGTLSEDQQNMRITGDYRICSNIRAAHYFMRRSCLR